MTVLVISVIVTPMYLTMPRAIDPVAILVCILTMIAAHAT